METFKEGAEMTGFIALKDVSVYCVHGIIFFWIAL